jgi:roadblock/LC7 domain-containing protein
MDAAGSGYPVRLDFAAPPTVARWRPLVNWILAIPQFIIAAGLQYLRRALLIVSFFMVLFTEQIPEQLFNLIVMTDRYEWRVKSFAFWMRESYPPFNFNMVSEDDGIDPASLSIAYPAKLKRWMPLVKWFLAIPHYFVLLFIYLAGIFVLLASFFAVLFTGKYPAGMRDFLVGSNRWAMRVRAYVGFLTDEYPPFSLS